MKLILILALAGFIQNANAANCSDQLNETVIQKINAELAAAAEKDNLIGMSYAVFDSKCTLMIGEYGISDKETKQPVSAKTSLFRLASTSKLFTVFSLAQLFEKKILTRDTYLMSLEKMPLVQLIKAYETPDRINKWSKIQLHHLMSHQSGISKDMSGSLIFFNTQSLSDHSYPDFNDFYNNFEDIEFLFEPGNIPVGMKYSNLAMNILARVVEAYNTEGLDFENYVAKHILEKNNMSNTFYNIPESMRETMVTGYGNLQPLSGTRTVVPKAFFSGSYDGSIGVASTASNLANLGKQILLLFSGKESNIVNSQDIILDLFSPKSFFTPSLAWASGPLWQVLPGETADDTIWTGHSGTGASERSILFVSPERGLGISLLFNTVDANREKYAKIIADNLPKEKITLGVLAKNIVENARLFLKNTKPAKPAELPKNEDTVSLQKYVGTYNADIIGNQNITISDDGYLVFYGSKLIPEATPGKFRFPNTAGPLFNSEPIEFKMIDGKVDHALVARVKIFKKIN